MLKIFEKMRHAQTPDRFTVDFLQTKLGFRGGNYRQFLPLAKKLGLLGTDGPPLGVQTEKASPSPKLGIFTRVEFLSHWHFLRPFKPWSSFKKVEVPMPRA